MLLWRNSYCNKPTNQESKAMLQDAWVKLQSWSSGKTLTSIIKALHAQRLHANRP
jgi:hypothetical protein